MKMIRRSAVLCLLFVAVLGLRQEEFEPFQQRARRQGPSGIGKLRELELGYSQRHEDEDASDQEQGTSHYYEVRKYPEHSFEYHIGHKHPKKSRDSQKPKKQGVKPHHIWNVPSFQAPNRQVEKSEAQHHRGPQKTADEIFNYKAFHGETGEVKEKDKKFHFDVVADRERENENSEQFQQKNAFRHDLINQEDFVFRPEKPSPFRLPSGSEREENIENYPKEYNHPKHNSKFIESIDELKYRPEYESIEKFRNHKYENKEHGSKNVPLSHETNYENFRKHRPESDESVETFPSKIRQELDQNYEKNRETFGHSQAGFDKETQTRDEFPRGNEEGENVPYVKPYPVFEPQPYPFYPGEGQNEQKSHVDDKDTFHRPGLLDFRPTRNPFSQEESNDNRQTYAIEKPIRTHGDRPIPQDPERESSRQIFREVQHELRNPDVESALFDDHSPFVFKRHVLHPAEQEPQDRLKGSRSADVKHYPGRPRIPDETRHQKFYSDTFRNRGASSAPTGKKYHHSSESSRENRFPRRPRYVNKRRITGGPPNMEISKSVDLTEFFKTLYND